MWPGPPCRKPRSGSETQFGRQLQAQFAVTPIYLRYNTGLPIAENCAQLAVLLEALLTAWPQPDSELVILGHMGLLNDRRVYRQIREWVAGACAY